MFGVTGGKKFSVHLQLGSQTYRTGCNSSRSGFLLNWKGHAKNNCVGSQKVTIVTWLYAVQPSIGGKEEVSRPPIKCRKRTETWDSDFPQRKTIDVLGVYLGRH